MSPILRVQMRPLLPHKSVTRWLLPHAHGSRGDRVFSAVCLSVFARYLKNRCSYKIIKLDTHDESWKPVYFWDQKVNGQGHESTAMGLCTLVSAGFF